MASQQDSQPVTAFDVELALGVIERFALRLNTHSQSCAHCGLSKFDDFRAAKAHETIVSSVRKIRTAAKELAGNTWKVRPAPEKQRRRK